MNFLPGQADALGFHVGDALLKLLPGQVLPVGDIKLGIRPEYLSLAEAHTPGALPAVVAQVQDVGTHIMLTVTVAGYLLKARLSADAAKQAIGDVVWLTLMGEHTCFYKNEEIVP
jgi:glycerol transport system ATP-binding protein